MWITRARLRSCVRLVIVTLFISSSPRFWSIDFNLSEWFGEPFPEQLHPVRSTTYYVIVLQEVVHSMMKSRRGTGDLIFKLDLKKAYDRLDWRFLEAIWWNLVSQVNNVFSSLCIVWPLCLSRCFEMGISFLALSLGVVCVRAILYPHIFLSFAWSIWAPWSHRRCKREVDRGGGGSARDVAFSSYVCGWSSSAY